MSGAMFSIFLNGVVIVLLMATIFYATRLTMYLKAFRENRRELDKLIGELGFQVDKAHAAIAGMNAAAKDSGKGLQDKINEARALRDELHLMTESADKLAGRIERVAVAPKARAEEPKKKRAVREAAPPPAREAVKPPPPPERIYEPADRSAGPSFSIRDTDFARGEMDQGLDEAALGEGGLQSKAERELYEALRKRRPGPGGDRS